MLYLILLIAGNVFVVETSGFSLNCTNDSEKQMSCYTDTHNCMGLRMALVDERDMAYPCVFSSCVKGCCCKPEVEVYFGDMFLAKVYKDGLSVHSQTVYVDDTFKPKTPSITSVAKLNGMYQIQWQTNEKPTIREELWGIVTHQKKGDHRKHSEHVESSTNEDRNYFTILTRNLEPSTTYVVSVKTYASFGVFSDSSNEVEFTTASSTSVSTIALILGLCVIAIIISGLAFASFVKLKRKCWDKVTKDEKPKLLDIKPSTQAILKPESLSVYSLSVEPLVPKDGLMLSKECLSETSGRSGQTSGISTASSSLDYANTEPVDVEAWVVEALKNAFPIFTLSPEKPTQNSLIPSSFEKAPSPIVFDNKTYISTQPVPSDGENMEMACDSGYHMSDAPVLQDFIISSQASAIMETDMSYQPCAQPVEASKECQNLLPVDYGYQDFEKLLEQSNNTGSVEKAGEVQSLVSGSSNNPHTADVVQLQSMLNPHLCNDIIVDHGYHCA